MERLTQDMADQAWAIIEEVEAMGGMTQAVASGWAKLRIEAAAAEKQARIDAGQDVIVGVNKYRLDEEAPVDIREIDNSAVREAQIERLAQVRAKRDAGAVAAALAALTECARERRGQPARPRDRRNPRPRDGRRDLRCARGGVGALSRDDADRVRRLRRAVRGRREWERSCKDEVEAFVAAEGRRPRLMVAKLGQDGHDRGAKVVATAFADLGFDVDIGPLFQTPEEAARQAIENDVHAIGVSTLAGGHKTLVPAIVDALRAQGADDIVVFVGGVIPQQDYAALYAAGRRRHLRPRHADSGRAPPTCWPRSARRARSPWRRTDARRACRSAAASSMATRDPAPMSMPWPQACARATGGRWRRRSR